MRELLRAYQDAVAGEVARFEGHVAKFMGDGVLAYFGWPRAHEDEAERAVRAGPGGRATRWRRCATPGGRAARGPGRDRHRPRRRRRPGRRGRRRGRRRSSARRRTSPPACRRWPSRAAVVIAEGTRRLLGGLFELRRLGPQRAEGLRASRCAPSAVRGERRGRGPLRGAARRGAPDAAGRPRAGAGAAARPLGGGPRPARARWCCSPASPASASRGSCSRCASGCGPSRAPALRYHCSPYHSQQRALPGDRAARARGRLRPRRRRRGQGSRSSRRCSPQAADDAARPCRSLADLLGVPPADGYPPPELTPQERKARTFEALLAQLEALARPQQPVLLVLEDAHWIDPTTLELFDLVVERIQRLPVLLVVTFRPGVPAALGRPRPRHPAGPEPPRPRGRRRRSSSGSPAARRCRPRCSSRSWPRPTACRCSSRS